MAGRRGGNFCSLLQGQTGPARAGSCPHWASILVDRELLFLPLLFSMCMLQPTSMPSQRWPCIKVAFFPLPSFWWAEVVRVTIHWDEQITPQTFLASAFFHGCGTPHHFLPEDTCGAFSLAGRGPCDPLGTGCTGLCPRHSEIRFACCSPSICASIKKLVEKRERSHQGHIRW